MNNKTVTENLKTALANSYALMLKTHYYHWNVTGPQFKALHDLFEIQYTEMFGAVDTIAERIRALGEKAPGSFQEFTSLSSLKSGNASGTAANMVQELKDDNTALAKILYEAMKVADHHGDQATVDLLSQRIATHEKNAWMLTSSL